MGDLFSNTVSKNVSEAMAVIAFLVTIVIVIILYVFILPDEKRPKLNKYFRYIHDFLKIRGLMIESIIRFFYVFFVVFTIVAGIITLPDKFWDGLFTIILGPIICRIIFEFLLLQILLVKNVIEINNHLKGIKDESSSETPVDFSSKAASFIGGLGKKIQDVTTSGVYEKSSNDAKVDDNGGFFEQDPDSGGYSENEIKTCPSCGKLVPEDSDFCIYCGTKIP